METKELTVLNAIRKSGGNADIADLKAHTGMDTMELTAIIGSLAGENRILLRINNQAGECQTYKTNAEILCGRFMDLLADNYRYERSVAFYASRLCITPKHLSTVVKATSGKLPSAWIREETIREIEHRLCHSRSSIKEIAYSLNFANTSFFGKYFKACKGVSPKQFCEAYIRTHKTPNA